MGAFEEFLINNWWADIIWELFKGVIPSVIALFAIAFNNKEQRRRDKENQLIKYKISIATDLQNSISQIREKSLVVEKALNNSVYYSDTEEKEKYRNVYVEKMNLLFEYAFIVFSDKEPVLEQIEFNFNREEMNKSLFEYKENLDKIEFKYRNENNEYELYLADLERADNKFNKDLNIIEKNMVLYINKLFNRKQLTKKKEVRIGKI